MDIIAQIKISGAKRINSLSDIKPNDRLFYELGHYLVIRKYYDMNKNLCEEKKWVRGGVFKEICNVQSFVKENLPLDKKSFIRHHNFMVLNQ